MTVSEQDKTACAEYVLGVMDADAALAFQARIDREDALAREVEAWETRFAPMNEQFVPEPAPDVFDAVSARLFGAPARPRLFAGLAWWKWALLGIVALVLVKAILLSGMLP